MTEEELKLRQQVISILLKRFGNELDGNGMPKYSGKSIYECAHDWISQGNVSTSGLVKYYEAYYTGSK